MPMTAGAGVLASATLAIVRAARRRSARVAVCVFVGPAFQMEAELAGCGPHQGNCCVDDERKEKKTVVAVVGVGVLVGEYEVELGVVEALPQAPRDRDRPGGARKRVGEHSTRLDDAEIASLGAAQTPMGCEHLCDPHAADYRDSDCG